MQCRALHCKLEDCCRSGEREAKRSKRDVTPSGKEHRGRDSERKEAHRDRNRDRERGKEKREEKDSSKRKDRDKDREEKERRSEKEDKEKERRSDKGDVEKERRSDKEDRDGRRREYDRDKDREKARDSRTEHAEPKENGEDRDRGRDARRPDGGDRRRDERHRDERHRLHCLHLYLCALMKADCSFHCSRLSLWQHRKNCRTFLFAFGPNKPSYLPLDRTGCFTGVRASAPGRTATQTSAGSGHVA